MNLHFHSHNFKDLNERFRSLLKEENGLSKLDSGSFYLLILLTSPVVLVPKYFTIGSLKEVIQPLLPQRLPCYDFTPIIGPTVSGAFLRGGLGDRFQAEPTFVV